MTWYTIKQLFTTIIGTYTPIEYSNGELYIDVPYVMGCIFIICVTISFLTFISKLFRNI